MVPAHAPKPLHPGLLFLLPMWKRERLHQHFSYTSGRQANSMKSQVEMVWIRWPISDPASSALGIGTNPAWEQCQRAWRTQYLQLLQLLLQQVWLLLLDSTTEGWKRGRLGQVAHEERTDSSSSYSHCSSLPWAPQQLHPRLEQIKQLSFLPLISTEEFSSLKKILVACKHTDYLRVCTA